MNIFCVDLTSKLIVPLARKCINEMQIIGGVRKKVNYLNIYIDQIVGLELAPEYNNYVVNKIIPSLKNKTSLFFCGDLSLINSKTNKNTIVFYSDEDSIISLKQKQIDAILIDINDKDWFGKFLGSIKDIVGNSKEIKLNGEPMMLLVDNIQVSHTEYHNNISVEDDKILDSDPNELEFNKKETSTDKQGKGQDFVQNEFEISLLKTIATYQEELSLLHEKAETFALEKDAVVKENDFLIDKISILNKLYNESKGRYDQISIENAQIQSKVQKLTETNESLSTAYHVYKSKCAKVNADSVELKQVIQTLENQATFLTNELTSSTVFLKETQEKLSITEKDGQKIKEELSLVKKAFSQIETEKNRISNVLGEANIALEKIIKENYELKKMINPPRYGAKQVFLEDLPYRLGSVIVHTKGLKGVIQVPPKLVQEIKAYHDRVYDAYQANNAIETYSDYKEIDKLKTHLSYQIGKNIIDTAKQPRRIFTLPMKLIETVVKFRAKKNKA